MFHDRKQFTPPPSSLRLPGATTESRWSPTQTPEYINLVLLPVDVSLGSSNVCSWKFWGPRRLQSLDPSLDCAFTNTYPALIINF